ncbi:MAG: hypothetical protein VX498_09725, partial [Myxococcota bacterium]|nr:hypothetical protein [Myxococcota bacterium]
YIAAEIAPWRQQQPHVVEAHRLAALVPDDAPVLVDDGRGDRPEFQASPMHLLSGRAFHYSYQQPWMDDDSTHELDPGSSQLREALLPPACCPSHPCSDAPPPCPEDPSWAMIHRSDELWLRRARAAGLVEIEQGQTWILLGPGEARSKPPPGERPTKLAPEPSEQPEPALPTDEPKAAVP